MISAAEWNEYCANVTQMMESRVFEYVTPLSISEQFGSGIAWGSGTYIQGANCVCVLTAAHVIQEVPMFGRLAHLPEVGGEYNAAFGSPAIASWPIDAAALPVHPAFVPAPSRIVPESSIAQRFNAVDEELLFWIGFPGYVLDRNDPKSLNQLRVSLFDQLSTPGKPMLTQAFKDLSTIKASNFSPPKHIAVHYPQHATRASDGALVALPKAEGMSGSALWDTKAVACALEGKPWNPHMAEICGVVWAVLDNPEAIFVTKIEHICLVPCDHIPRRSWPLFRAKAMLGDLIAGFSSPGIQSHQEQLAA